MGQIFKVQLEMLKLLAKALEIGYVIVQMRKMVLLAKGNVDSLSQYHDLHTQVYRHNFYRHTYPGLLGLQMISGSPWMEPSSGLK